MTYTGTEASLNPSTMTSNNQTQGSRLPNYAMSKNGTENTQQILGNALSRAGLQPGSSVWGNNTSNGYGTSKDRVTPRDVALGRSTTLGTASDNDPWGVAWNLADITQQARNLSGNTSPRSRSDASVHDVNGGSSYYRAAPLLSNRPVGSKPASTTALDPPTTSFNHASQLSAFADERDFVSLGDHMGHEPKHRLPKPSAGPQRQAHQPFFKDGSSSFSLNSGSDLHSQTNSFRDFKQGGSAARSINNQQPSLADLAFSSSHDTGGYDQSVGRETDQYPLSESFARLAMNSGSNGATDTLANLLSHGNGTQNFQLNPVSQPWETGQGYGTGFPKDMHSSGPGFEKRGSIVDRSSPAGSTYRASGGLSSPRSFTGTPQPSVDAWSRPASRDLGMGSGFERRGLGQQHFMQQPPAPFFPSPAYYPQPYPQFPPVYGAYDPRQTVSMAGYGMPIAHIAVAPGTVQTHPTAAPTSGLGYRDLFLEEFKSSWKSHNRYELKDIYGKVRDLAGDQEGSRFIQKKLDTANSDEKAQIFMEIEPNAVPLMKCVFGNYVLQKLFDLGTQVQKRVLVNAMKGKVVDLSTQMYGCRVVQKALQTVLVEQQAELVKELKPDLLKVAKDQHGNHVIQVAIQLVPRQYIDFIMDGLKGRVCELASHQFGCRVIQRALEHGTKEDKAVMMQELHKGAQALITDMYGNYVIQHILENGEPADRSRLINLVIPQLLTLSRQKYASNVVEKCIIYGKREEQQAIRDQLIASGEDANSPLFLLMKDQYGNYVTQKLIKNLDPRDREVLLEKMRPQLQPLKRSGATSKQVAAIERAISEVTTASSPDTGEPTPASTAPTSPGLQVDTNSDFPTPNLTMDPNSPLSTPSSGLPYANGDATEVGADPATGQPAGKATATVHEF